LSFELRISFAIRHLPAAWRSFTRSFGISARTSISHWNSILDTMSDELEAKIEAAIKNPRNLGEMKDADAVGTVGSADCGDMLRMWIKFKEENGRKVIDRATFQSFGCQTAIAVASVATEMLKGKTAAEASTMSGEELAAPLGPLPPVKIHCAQLVEGALRSALAGKEIKPAETGSTSPTLLESLSGNSSTQKKVKVVLKATDEHR
jgi:nitrogen fixation NifU-like protein